MRRWPTRLVHRDRCFSRRQDSKARVRSELIAARIAVPRRRPCARGRASRLRGVVVHGRDIVWTRLYNGQLDAAPARGPPCPRYRRDAPSRSLERGGGACRRRASRSASPRSIARGARSRPKAGSTRAVPPACPRPLYLPQPAGFRIQRRSSPAPKTRRTRHNARPKWLAATRPQAVTGVSADKFGCPTGCP